jgi:hypothetical protein
MGGWLWGLEGGPGVGVHRCELVVVGCVFALDCWGRLFHVPGKHVGPPTETVRPGDDVGLPPLSRVVGWESS